MNSYVVTQIRIINFRQFRDVKIKLNPKPGKNLVIIQGKSGSGKSNLMHAIRWGLSIKHPLDKFILDRPNCNWQVFKHLKNNSVAEILVRITLKSIKEHLEITRVIKVLKNSSGQETIIPNSSKITAVSITSKGRTQLPRPEEIITRIFHKSIASFIDASELCQAIDFDSSGEIMSKKYKKMFALWEKNRILPPVVIDSPFYFLDDKLRGSITDLIMSHTQGIQLILILTANQYLKEVSACLAPHVSNTLVIRCNRDLHTASITKLKTRIK